MVPEKFRHADELTGELKPTRSFSQPNPFHSRPLWNVKTSLYEKNSRYFVQVFISLWKMLLFFFLFLAFSVTFAGISDVDLLFSDFSSSFRVSQYNINVNVGKMRLDAGTVPTEWLNLPTEVLVTQVRDDVFICPIRWT